MKKKAIKKPAKNKDARIYCDISKCLGCRSCELACAVEHSSSKNMFFAHKEAPLPKKRLKVENIEGRIISLHCQHCEEALCVQACMSGALNKDEKTGATTHDRDKCVGCWMCVMVCPFGAIVRDIEEHIAVKCDLCPGREDYACVLSCPTGALFAGTKEEFEKKIKRSAGKRNKK